jgi:hypothetical protein
MDKKIKSVKLKNDYRDEYLVIKAGTELVINQKGDWLTADGRGFAIRQITDCKTDLFDIEYEPEAKSITVKIEYEFNDYMLGIGDVIHAMRDYNEKRVLDKPEYFQNLKVTEIK